MTKLDSYFFVSVDKQRFWGFEKTSSSRDTSPLSGSALKLACTPIFISRIESKEP